MYEFSERLRSLRKELKLSQKEVALDLDVSQALLSHYERGIRECGLDFLVKIAAYYGVSVDYILGRTNSKSGLLFLDENGEFIDVVNAMQIILDQIAELRDANVSSEARELFEIEISKLVNMVSAFSGDRTDIFGADYGMTSSLLNCAESRSKAKLLFALKNCENEAPDFSEASISKKYPNTYKSLINVTKRGEKTAKGFLENQEN